MQAITTKYIGPTDFKGSRIKATCDAGSITIPYPHELFGEAVHAAAAMALVRKLKWDTHHGEFWVGGGVASNYVFVNVRRSSLQDDGQVNTGAWQSTFGATK